MSRNLELAPIYKKYARVPYDFNMGPEHVLGKEIIRAMNCQAFVHLVFNDKGYPLPPELKSKEIFEDQGVFRDVNYYAEELRPFDIFVFGRRGEADPKKLHLAVYAGADGNGRYMFFHKTKIKGQADPWPLEEFLRRKRYAEIFAVKRHRILEKETMVVSPDETLK